MGKDERSIKAMKRVVRVMSFRIALIMWSRIFISSIIKMLNERIKPGITWDNKNPMDVFSSLKTSINYDP